MDTPTNLSTGHAGVKFAVADTREEGKKYLEIRKLRNERSCWVENNCQDEKGSKYFLGAQTYEYLLPGYLKYIRSESNSQSLWRAIGHKKELRMHRPHQKVLNALAGILKAVAVEHLCHRTHGGLRHQESYALEIDEDYVGEAKVEVVKVHLLPGKGCDLYPAENDEEFQRRVVRDWHDVYQLIFNDILASRDLPKDLDYLKELLQGINSYAAFKTNYKKIVTHHSLWTYQERHGYCLKAHRIMTTMTYKANAIANNALQSRDSFQNWQGMFTGRASIFVGLTSDPPFKLLIQDGSPLYKPEPEDLLRFSRDIPVHLHKKHRNRFCYLEGYDEERDYGNFEFIEARFLHHFPNFIEDVRYCGMDCFRL